MCISFFFINKEPVFELKGSNNITMEVNGDYKDQGYTAKYLNKDISNKVKIENNLDIKKIGKYQIIYYLNFRNKIYHKVRKINVVDNLSTVINLIGNSTIELCPNEDYIEPGYKAFDKYNNDLTNNVRTNINDNQVIYSLENGNGNIITTKRNIVRSDKDAPTLSLEGYQSSTLYLGSTYYEAGYSATDNCDGDITDKVTVEGSVNTNKVGKYKLTYSVVDNYGNITSTDRIINIIEKPDAGQKTIYLTFDDGPSSTTTKILDILKEKGIKATFFVINAPEKYNNTIKRAYDEGHTIGLHSYSHKYKSIYKSEDAFFEDLNLINNKVKKITGYKSNIIRFPGGSSNTISKISKGIMTKLSIKTKEKGFIYFDWNIASYDTSNISSKRIYQKVITQLEKNNYNTNIILMHDFENNKKTVNALKEIIKYGKSNGYKFDKITEMTPQIKHKIRN